jgi:hypothetical protein
MKLQNTLTEEVLLNEQNKVKTIIETIGAGKRSYKDLIKLILCRIKRMILYRIKSIIPKSLKRKIKKRLKKGRVLY